MKILYQDKKILIVDKPAGMLSHPAKGHREPDLLSELRHPEYSLISRLDYQTSGLLLVAKDAESASALNRLATKNFIKKIYMAVLSGYLSNKEDVLHSWLLKDELSAIVRLSDHEIPGSVRIVTRYRVLKQSNGFTLAEIELETGRTHQIRAQMAKIGHPVVGDPLYGDKNLNKRNGLFSQALVSMKIRFAVDDEKDPFRYLDDKTFTKDEFPFIYLMEQNRPRKA